MLRHTIAAAINVAKVKQYNQIKSIIVIWNNLEQ